MGLYQAKANNSVSVEAVEEQVNCLSVEAYW